MAVSAGALLGATALSGAMSAGNSALSSYLQGRHMYRQYKYQKKLAQFSYDLERKGRLSAFGDTKQSLLDAGYNPMLAIGQQAQGLTPSMGSVDGGSQQVNIDPVSAMSAFNAMKRNDTMNTVDIQNAENNALESVQRQGLTKAQTENQLIKNDVDRATMLDTAMANLENIKTNSAKQAQEVQNLKHDIVESNSRIIKNIAEKVNIDTNTERNLMENRDIAEYADWRNAHPALRRGDYFGRDTGIKPRDVMMTGANLAGAKALGAGLKGNSAISVQYRKGR